MRLMQVHAAPVTTWLQLQAGYTRPFFFSTLELGRADTYIIRAYILSQTQLSSCALGRKDMIQDHISSSRHLEIRPP